jgi:ABC-type arginine transport system ATPase subunit
MTATTNLQHQSLISILDPYIHLNRVQKSTNQYPLQLRGWQQSIDAYSRAVLSSASRLFSNAITKAQNHSSKHRFNYAGI